MKMASQRFCLRWNNHQSNLLSVFDQLLHAETFTDVTLAVEGQLLKAHKMVLSACSPYFQALFVNHQEKHPIVILKDVPYSDMKSLLDFMYRGEVSVDQERLTAFLRVAESLRIKGLTEVNEEKCDIPALTNSLLLQQQQSTNVPDVTPPPQLHRIHPYLPQKRPQGVPSGGAPPNLLMPLLGNALLQPKRKRGRPRKLSGSSNDAVNTATSPPNDFTLAAETGASEQLLRGSPEMLEVKMSMEGFHGTEDGATSGGEDGGEALLIDEGDDGPSADGLVVKDSDSTGFDHHNLFYEEGGFPNSDSSPIITVELVPRNGKSHNTDTDVDPNHPSNNVTIRRYLESKLGQPDETLVLDGNSGVHFLTSDQQDQLITPKLEPLYDEDVEPEILSPSSSPSKTKHDLLEYLVRQDGSVVCKLCGEILQSRTHWYRHKYKFHAMPAMTPAPLFQCELCSVYFKSRKGYIGHLASRHPDSEMPHSDVPHVPAESPLAPPPLSKDCPDPELVLPRTQIRNCNVPPVGRKGQGKAIEGRRQTRSYNRGEPIQSEDWEQKRSREEKLVADIIARVRRECALSGADGGARRGYTRRNSLTNNT